MEICKFSKRNRNRLQQKKAEELETKQNRYITYDLLNERFFITLKENIVLYQKRYHALPDITFYIPEDGHSSLYIEAKTHIKKNIKDFYDRFELLQKNIEEYNKNHDRFEKEEI